MKNKANESQARSDAGDTPSAVRFMLVRPEGAVSYHQRRAIKGHIRVASDPATAGGMPATPFPLCGISTHPIYVKKFDIIVISNFRMHT